MRVNGRKISKKEELRLVRREIKRLTVIIRTKDYRQGASALNDLKFEREREKNLKKAIRIRKLEREIYSVRNNTKYDKMTVEIEKLNSEIPEHYKLKNPEIKAIGKAEKRKRKIKNMKLSGFFSQT